MRQHFKEYSEVYNQIKELQYKLEVLNRYLYDVKAVQYEVHARTSLPKSIVERLVERDEVLEKIETLSFKKQELYEKHIKEISALEKEESRSVLRCYYLNKMSVNEISKMLYLSKQHIYRLKCNGEHELENLLKMRQNA